MLPEDAALTFWQQSPFVATNDASARCAGERLRVRRRTGDTKCTLYEHHLNPPSMLCSFCASWRSLPTRRYRRRSDDVRASALERQPPPPLTERAALGQSSAAVPGV